jgi:hypothetical protein
MYSFFLFCFTTLDTAQSMLIGSKSFVSSEMKRTKLCRREGVEGLRARILAAVKGVSRWGVVTSDGRRVSGGKKMNDKFCLFWHLRYSSD